MARKFITDITGPQGRDGVRGVPGRDGATHVVDIAGATDEWWVTPVATQLQTPYPRIVKGSYSEAGQILASESVPGAGTRSVVIDVPNWPVDDHNTPAYWAEDGHRHIMMWTRHGEFNPVWMVVSDRQGTIDSLATAPVQELVTVDPIHPSNYVQIHRIRHLSTVDGAGLPLLDYFWAFTRRGDRWQIIRFTINQTTGAYAFIDRVTVVTLGGLQAYVTSADTNTPAQKFRLAAYANPTTDYHAIWYLEVDPVTGIVTSPLDASVNYTLGTNDTGVAVYAGGTSAVTPLIPDAGTTISRRIFGIRPGPVEPAVLWGEWPVADRTAGVYKLTEWNGTAWVTTSLGPIGAEFWRISYFPGGCFANPCRNRDVLLARNLAESTLERSFIGRSGARESELLATAAAGNVIARPSLAVNGSAAGGIYTELSAYADDFTFRGNIQSVGMNVSSSRASEPLLGDGSLIMVDFSSPDRPTFGVPATGATIPNLAAPHLAQLIGWGAAGDMVVSNTVSAATGKVERTKQGGLHVIAKQAGTVASESFLASFNDAVAQYLNENWSHDLYVGVITAVTRKRVIGSGALNPPLAGLRASSATADPGWAKIYATQGSGNLASSPTTYERIGFQNGTASEGVPMLVDIAVQTRTSSEAAWATTPLSKRFIELGNVLTTSTNNAQSAIVYVAYLEDLTVSGRSYARVHSLMNDLLASGRFSNDTYTAPASI